MARQVFYLVCTNLSVRLWHLSGSLVNLCMSSHNKWCVWQTHMDWMSLTTAVVWPAASVVLLKQGAPLHSTLWSEDYRGKSSYFIIYFHLKSFLFPFQSHVSTFVLSCLILIITSNNYNSIPYYNRGQENKTNIPCPNIVLEFTSFYQQSRK